MRQFEPLPPTPEIPVNRWPLILAVVAAATTLFFLLQPILLPFVLGALIGYLGDPIVDRLEARGASRTTGVAIVFVVYTGLSLLALLIAVPLLLQQLDNLISRIPVVYSWLRDVALPWLQTRTQISGAQLPSIDWSAELVKNWQSLGKMTTQAVTQITGSGLGILLSLANVALVPVVA
ncbi:MAG: AI-2E family transporter, partial [Pseudomonadota bacterium]